MSALQDRRVRLLASLYATFGEAAVWTSAAGGAETSVTVRRKSQPGEVGFGESTALVDRDIFKVRRAELAAPAKGDLVTLTDSGEQFRIIADPQPAKAGLEWVCEPGPVRNL